MATAEDVREFYGKPTSGTLRAMVVYLDGIPAGLVGVVRDEWIGKYFSDYKPMLQPYLQSITIMRAVKASMQFVDGYNGPVIAVAESAKGALILHRLGFTHLQGELYGWLK